MNRVYNIELDYSSLWIILINLKMSKAELSKQSTVDEKTLKRMTDNKPVHLSVVLKICRALGCKISDVVKIKRKKFSFPKVNAENMRLNYAGIYNLIDKYKISMNEFALRTGLSYQTVKMIKNGEPIHLSAVLKICECFDCEIEDIVEVVDNE